MKYLLDTHILLWWLNNDRQLKDSIREVIKDQENDVLISVASAWEISIKLKTNPSFKLKTSIERAFTVDRFPILDIKLEHAIETYKLPLHHKDPFDRMLIAQAKVERCTLITNDPKIRKYKVSVIG